MAISVTDPIGQAMRRTGEVLFRPFRFGKWLTLGLVAALYLLGEGGGGGGNFNSFRGMSGGGGGPGGGGGGEPRPEFAQMVQNARDWVMANLIWLIPAVLVGFLVLTAVYLVVRWLSARGTFMLYDNVVNNDARVAAPWTDFRLLARSLFRFRILWDLLWFNLWLVWLIVTGFIIWPDIKNFIVTEHYEFTSRTTIAIVFGALGLIVLWALSMLFHGVVFRLAVPVMYVRRMPAWPAVKTAWRELFVPHLGACILYFLLSVVIAIVQGLWAMAAMLVFSLATCFIGCCLASIPFVGTYILAVLCLPVLAFDRAYTLYFISQFGPDYQVAWQVPAAGGFPVIMDEPSGDHPPEPPTTPRA
jgi:hypothetical protein